MIHGPYPTRTSLAAGLLHHRAERAYHDAQIAALEKALGLEPGQSPGEPPPAPKPHRAVDELEGEHG